jgi:hypothetical protein
MTTLLRAQILTMTVTCPKHGETPAIPFYDCVRIDWDAHRIQYYCTACRENHIIEFANVNAPIQGRHADVAIMDDPKPRKKPRASRVPLTRYKSFTKRPETKRIPLPWEQ